MNIFEESVTRLIELFNKHEVKYLLVGGLAVNYHGYSRTTGDVDFWLKDSQENREKLVSAFEEYGIGGAEVFLHLPLQAGFSEVMLDSGIYLDLMSSLQSFPQDSFDKCYGEAAAWEFEPNIFVKVLSLSSLLEEKENSKRPKDQIDATELRATQNPDA